MLHSDIVDDPMLHMTQDITDRRTSLRQRSQFARRIQRIDKAIKVLYFVAVGFIIAIILGNMIGTVVIEDNLSPNDLGLTEFSDIMEK